MTSFICTSAAEAHATFKCGTLSAAVVPCHATIIAAVSAFPKATLERCQQAVHWSLPRATLAVFLGLRCRTSGGSANKLLLAVLLHLQQGFIPVQSPQEVQLGCDTRDCMLLPQPQFVPQLR